MFFDVLVVNFGVLIVFVCVWNLQLKLGVDESYSLLLGKGNGYSIVGEVTIEVSLDCDCFRD